MEDKTHLSIRMDSRLHDKFRYVSGAEGCTMSGQIMFFQENVFGTMRKQMALFRRTS